MFKLNRSAYTKPQYVIPVDLAMKIDLISYMLAFCCPPISVYLFKGVSHHLLISVLLTLLFFIPGVMHAIWLISNENFEL